MSGNCRDPCNYVAIMETKMDGMEKKLDLIASEMREMNKQISKLHTGQAVDTNDISNIGKKCDAHDGRIIALETKQQWLIAKVSTVASFITLFFAAILNWAFSN